MKKLIFGLFTAAIVGLGPLQAAEMPTPIPVVVAESEEFEIVGRLDEKGFVFHIDRSASNAPVLAAKLEVEADGRLAPARFRPESGDYLIDDAAWLSPLRTPGEHALAFTLLAGEESDLLSADFAVLPASTAGTGTVSGLAWPLAGTALLVLAVLGWRFSRQHKGDLA
ncbi:hypothetical protein AT959_02675 [Dechloromonas denitrificans]|uniref:CopC domain-containing protein n=1 Tax=Dechloromonas denitrificans TaxID=281362 RepID=A0A133XM23_9RHOO|nr:hypothetical protein [Dechloromonas denitrificans]KXB31984.1 hypothetical protein AT959_02675 [Dechloromonas denitrificans]